MFVVRCFCLLFVVLRFSVLVYGVLCLMFLFVAPCLLYDVCCLVFVD